MPNDLKKLRRLMKAANHIRKEKPVILRGATPTQGQALKYAWWFENFRNKLRTGIWRFSYFKVDGSIREAIGTLCGEYIPANQLPKGCEDVPTCDTFVYYDIKAQGWRSFRLENFIGFVEEVILNS
jgi:hypothetical protein